MKGNRVQVLIATLMQTNIYQLLDRMNITSDVVVGNQCNENKIEEFEYKNNTVLCLNLSERGVGLNRNNALMRATGDICLFADDDMNYVDNYVDLVQASFKENPTADVLIFNLKEVNSKRYIIKKKHRVRYWNYLRYGTARVAIRLDSIRREGIYFNQCFGGGTEHCHGEDNIFLAECLKKGLKIYALPIAIACLDESRESTWNHGYDGKYISDQGVLYRTISKRHWKLLCLQDALRRSKRDYKTSWYSAYKLMIGK